MFTLTIVTLAVALGAASDVAPGFLTTPTGAASAPAPSVIRATMLGEASSAAGGPMRAETPPRWFLDQPIAFQGGAWVYRGYVRNDHAFVITQVRLEIAFPDGSTVTHLIAADVAPGERVSYETRQARSDIDGWQARLLFRTTRAPSTARP